MKAFLALALVAATALAGCTGGADESQGFSVREPSEPGGAYVFSATADADSYRWDLGDRLTVKEGKRVEHVYDFDHGVITVRMDAVDADGIRSFSRTLQLGDGENTKPALVLEAQTNWTVPGEVVRFSGVSSQDADGDTMRFAWNCIRTGDAVRQGAHVHPNTGVPFQTPGSGSGVSRLAPDPLPEPGHDFGPDMCAAMQGARFSTQHTVQGAFNRSGVYDITLVGSDGPSPTISTSFTVWVTAPDARPAPVRTWAFNGTLLGGAGGTGQSTGGTVGGAVGQQPPVLDQEVHRFDLEVNARTLALTCQSDGGPATVGAVDCVVRRGGAALHDPTADGWTGTALKEGAYEVVVTLQQGIQVGYTATVRAEYDMDPGKYF